MLDILISPAHFLCKKIYRKSSRCICLKSIVEHISSTENELIFDAFLTQKTSWFLEKKPKRLEKMAGSYLTPKIHPEYIGYGKNTFSKVILNVRDELFTHKTPMFAIKQSLIVPKLNYSQNTPKIHPQIHWRWRVHFRYLF